MIKAIFYKEWIKTKWVYILGMILLSGFSIYLLLNFFRVVELKGMTHLWDVMIQRDAIFIDMLRFVPILLGVSMGVAQFVPEMYHKNLKLTLHLPFEASRMIAAMLGYGFVSLSTIFAVGMLILYIGFAPALTPELVAHVLLTAFVWYLAALVGYFLCSWVVLEPTWKRRMVNTIISVLCMRVFFFASAPEAYNAFIPMLCFFMAASFTFPFLSIERFKTGKQD